MKHANYLLAFIATFTFTLLAEAKEIYESQGKEGRVEFTDQPSPSAKVVNIQETNIADAVDSPQPGQDKPETKKITKRSDPGQPGVVYRNVVGKDDKNPKRIHREQQIQERREERQEGRENKEGKERPKKSADGPTARGR